MGFFLASVVGRVLRCSWCHERARCGPSEPLSWTATSGTPWPLQDPFRPVGANERRRKYIIPKNGTPAVRKRMAILPLSLLLLAPRRRSPIRGALILLVVAPPVARSDF